MPWLPDWQAGRLSIRLLVKDALWSHISRCTAKDPPLLTLAFSNISWFNPRVEEGGFGTAQLQWLVGLHWWSHAGSQSTITCKQTGQEKQRNVGELFLLLHCLLSLPVCTQEKADGLIVALTVYCSDTSFDLVKWFPTFFGL